jgi:hypothetical protein
MVSMSRVREKQSYYYELKVADFLNTTRLTYYEALPYSP